MDKELSKERQGKDSSSEALQNCTNIRYVYGCMFIGPRCLFPRYLLTQRNAPTQHSQLQIHFCFHFPPGQR
jgi:hypothetical protein